MRKLLILSLLFFSTCNRTPSKHGDFSIFQELGWIDTHVHLRSHHQIAAYVAYQDGFGMKAMSLQVIPNPRSLTEGHRPNRNTEAMLAKALYPDRFYVFAGLDLTMSSKGDASILADDLRKQIEALDAAGVDGIKIWLRTDFVEGFKEATGLSLLLDSPVMAEALAVIEKRDLPVLLHLDAQYADSGYAAIKAYPRIRWFVAHMAMHNNFARLGKLLDLYENITIDVGHYVFLGELMRRDPDGSREFFERYAGRVFQSTDIGAGCGEHKGPEQDCPNEAVIVDAAWVLRAMMETKYPLEFVSVFDGVKVRVTGLDLPLEQLRMLYRDNALARLGSPKPLVCDKALTVVDQLRLRTVNAEQQSLMDEMRAMLANACK